MILPPPAAWPSEGLRPGGGGRKDHGGDCEGYSQEPAFRGLILGAHYSAWRSAPGVSKWYITGLNNTKRKSQSRCRTKPTTPAMSKRYTMPSSATIGMVNQKTQTFGP
jgi:hypothetical protein